MTTVYFPDAWTSHRAITWLAGLGDNASKAGLMLTIHKFEIHTDYWRDPDGNWALQSTAAIDIHNPSFSHEKEQSTPF